MVPEEYMYCYIPMLNIYIFWRDDDAKLKWINKVITIQGALISARNFMPIDPIVVETFHYKLKINLMVELEEKSGDH